MSAKTRARAFCLTTNNYTEADLVSHKDHLIECEYGIIGEEVGEQGTPHLQCYFRYKNARDFKAVSRKFPKSHIEVAKGDDSSNKEYCTKSGKFTEAGIPKEKKPGKRTDLEDFVKTAQETELTWKQVVLEHPQIAARYSDWAKTVINYTRADRAKTENVLRARVWQRALMDAISEPADDRHIIWVYDQKGGAGKTSLARFLVDSCGAFYTNGGKALDIAYAYDCEPIVVFDYVRENQEFLNYGIIEALKNGILSSNKYNSVTKRFHPPHVIVMANFMPAIGKFSPDRIICMDISKPESPIN